ncbi:MAG: hypothetical protein N2Z85_02880 [Patescibacteria group bacterium]|nr:hypothetical protein [Patescibacteria group bacterium]
MKKKKNKLTTLDISAPIIEDIDSNFLFSKTSRDNRFLIKIVKLTPEWFELLRRMVIKKKIREGIKELSTLRIITADGGRIVYFYINEKFELSGFHGISQTKIFPNQILEKRFVEYLQNIYSIEAAIKYYNDLDLTENYIKLYKKNLLND